MVRRLPVPMSIVPAYAPTRWGDRLLQSNPMNGLFGLSGPALAAISVTAITDDPARVRARLVPVVRWRVPVRWSVLLSGCRPCSTCCRAELPELPDARKARVLSVLVVIIPLAATWVIRALEHRLEPHVQSLRKGAGHADALDVEAGHAGQPGS